MLCIFKDTLWIVFGYGYMISPETGFGWDSDIIF